MEVPCNILPHLYFANAIPSPEEVALIQRNNEWLQGLISYYESYLQWNMSALSVVRQVPPEVLGEIFQHTVGLAPLGEDGRKQVIDLCLVSKGWYDAALSCHQLWNRVSVEASLLSFNRVTAWLGRAGTVPTTLEVVANEECDDAIEPDSQLENPELLRLLSQGLHLDNLSLSFPDPECFESMVDALESFEPLSDSTSPRPWDTVRVLTLNFCDDWYDSTSPEDTPFLKVPKTITSLQLRLPLCFWISRDYSAMGPVLHLPPYVAENLTTFTISGDWDVHHLLGLLTHCTNLQELTIDHDSHDLANLHGEREEACLGHIRSLNISLPQLHTLRLRRTSFYIFPFLQLLDMPSLINLDLEFHDVRSMTMDALLNFAPLFADFLQTPRKLGRQLRYLRLADAFICSSVLGIFEDLTRLTHLVLDNNDCQIEPTGDLFQALQAQKEENPTRPCFPRLKILELHRLPPTFDFLSLSEYLRICKPQLKELVVSYDIFLEPSEFAGYYVGVGNMKARSGTLVHIYRCAKS